MSYSEVRSKPRKLQCGVEKLTDELGASEKDPNSLQSAVLAASKGTSHAEKYMNAKMNLCLMGRVVMCHVH